MNTTPLINNEVVIKEIRPDYKEKALSYLQKNNLHLNEKEAEHFLEICSIYQLNPFIREIYPILFQNKLNIVVGYEVYLKRAERSKLLKGWKVYTKGSLKNGDLFGCIEINRKDFENTFYHEVAFLEYKKNTQLWQEKPLTMIKKVAIAQGFRLAFPCELGGMPYTSEELNGDFNSFNEFNTSQDVSDSNELINELLLSASEYDKEIL